MSQFGFTTKNMADILADFRPNIWFDTAADTGADTRTDTLDDTGAETDTDTRDLGLKWPQIEGKGTGDGWTVGMWGGGQYSRVSPKAPLVMKQPIPPIFLFHFSSLIIIFFLNNFFNLFFYCG